MRLKRDEMTVKGILGAARSALLLIIICSAVSYTVSDLLGDPSLLKAFLYGLAIWAGLTFFGQGRRRSCEVPSVAEGDMEGELDARGHHTR